MGGVGDAHRSRAGRHRGFRRGVPVGRGSPHGLLPDEAAVPGSRPRRRHEGLRRAVGDPVTLAPRPKEPPMTTSTRKPTLANRFAWLRPTLIVATYLTAAVLCATGAWVHGCTLLS